jgi:opine dehydrogenase
MSTVAVLGAGHGGCAAAADLTLRGFEVRLTTRRRETLAPIMERGGVELIGEAGEGFAKIAKITTDLREAVDGADILLVTVPTTAHGHYARALAKLLSPQQIVMLNPGHTCGGLHFAAELRRQGIAWTPRLCETFTLTYGCRMAGSAAVNVMKVATNLLFAAFPGRNRDELLAACRKLYPNLVPADNVLHSAFLNINAIEHPPQALLNVGWLEHTRGDYLFYYEGTTPSVGRAIDVLDAERVAVARALGLRSVDFYEIFWRAGYTTEAAARTRSAYQCLQESAPNRWVKGPKSLDHRYIHEDVGHGLVPMAEFGRMVGVATPLMDALIQVASVVNGIDYRTEGLTLDRMGLEGMKAADLERFLLEGPG